MPRHKSAPIVTTIAAALLATSIQAGRAADSVACTAYANAAVAAATEVRKLKCEYDLNHPQWFMTFDVHLKWCMGAEQAAVDHEKANRNSQLIRCRACAQYADDAVQNVKTINSVRMCMKSPNDPDPRYSLDPAVHRKWCLQMDDQDRDNEHWSRFGEATFCVSCQAYAQKAVDDFNRYKKCAGKAPEGDLWSASYIDHFNWCKDRRLGRNVQQEDMDEFKRGQAVRQACTSTAKQGLSKSDSSTVVRRPVNPARAKSESNSTRSALSRRADPTKPKSASKNTSSENTVRVANPCQPGRVTNPCKNNSRVLSPGLLEGGGGFATQGPSAIGTRSSSPAVSHPSGSSGPGPVR
jgi:hypothetical protein